MPGMRNWVALTVLSKELELQLAVDSRIVIGDGNVHVELIGSDGLAQPVCIGLLDIAKRFHLKDNLVLRRQVVGVTLADNVGNVIILPETLVDGHPLVHQATVTTHITVLPILVDLSHLFSLFHLAMIFRDLSSNRVRNHFQCIACLHVIVKQGLLGFLPKKYSVGT